MKGIKIKRAGVDQKQKLTSRQIIFRANKGILPIVCEELFKEIKKLRKSEEGRNIEYQVQVSMLEIYNEVVSDLLTNKT